MARVELAPEVGADLDRIWEHLRQDEVVDASVRIREIIEGISGLEHNPRIGRPVPGDLQKLIIGRQSHGYVALYRYLADLDLVLVLAIRGQREAGYKRL